MKKKVLSAAMALSLANATFLPVAGNVLADESKPDLIMTEVYPDDIKHTEIAGAGSNDLFEYVELYNPTDQDISFNDLYEIVYDYGSNKKSLQVTSFGEDPLTVELPAGQAAVLWVKRTNSSISGDAAKLTQADFRSFHGLEDDVQIFSLTGQDGLNNSDRGIQLVEKRNPSSIKSAIYYNSDDVADGKSVHLQPALTGTELHRYKQKADPTPGAIEEEQKVPPSARVIAIEHTSITEVKPGNEVSLSAVIQGAESATLYIKPAGQQEFSPYPMAGGESGLFHITIPAEDLSDGVFHYYIEAEAEGMENAISQEYSFTVASGEEPKNIPSILITEIMPNPEGDYRKGSGNQYEYMELYNTTDEAINLKGHTLFYLYPGTTAPKKWTIQEDTVILPHKPFVIWFAKEAISAGYGTVEDFNIHFNSSLTEKDILLYDNGKPEDFNLPNSLERGFALSSSDQLADSIIEAWYDASSDSSPDAQVRSIRNTVIRYSYPASGKIMERMDTRPFGNPGSIDSRQVSEPAGKDVVSPLLSHEQLTYQAEQNKPVRITVASDEILEEAAFLYGESTETITDFKHSVPLDFKEESNGQFIYEGNIQISETGIYRYMIQGADKSGNITKFPYSSRGLHLTVTEPSGENAELPAPGLSVKNGQMVRGSLNVYAYGETAASNIQMKLDSKDLSIRPALPGITQFGFQANGIDQIYQASASAIKAGAGREYFTRIYPKYVDGAWYKYSLAPEYFVESQTVSIHSGSESVPYDSDTHDQYFNKTNFDDFNVRNIHLVLPDGTMLKPETVKQTPGNLNIQTVPYTENLWYGLGDGTAPTNTNMNKPLKSEFQFNIPKKHFTARYVSIDTTVLPDGEHTVYMDMDGVLEQEAVITVDNTEPVIHGVENSMNGTKLEKDAVLKGEFSLSLLAEDSGTGIASIEATLDGEKINMPFSSSSSAISAGSHILKITAFDGAGNSTSTEQTLIINEEMPEEPVDVKPADFSKGVSHSPRLSAIVKDPSGDAIKTVDFMEGTSHDFASQKGITGFKNIADREPPLTAVPEGETEISADEQQAIAYDDEKYLVTDSEQGFPYHRFEVKVGEELTAGSKVELLWKGKTLPNRMITLYAWDYQTGKWTSLKREKGNPNENEILLAAEVEKERFIKDGKIQAMVQDEVAGPNDPFSILWFTDTQYYSESYPGIWESMSDWIVDSYKEGIFQYAIHTGDLVNVADDENQWRIVDENLKKLEEANVPYGVLAGNHDVIVDGIDYSYYKKYVGADRYVNNPWYGGQMDNNRNHYDLVSFGGHDFIILYVGFGLEDTEETIQWANEVLEKHSDRNAIIGMHAYLEYNATLSNMAQNVFNQVVVPNENVKLILSGHYHGANRRVTELTNQDGSKREVVEVLADYQGGPEGGQGYLRLLTFDPATEKVDFQTYSPYLNDYNFFDENIDAFKEDFDLADINKRVSTDYVAVNVYFDKEIGQNRDLKSGDTASVQWSGLEESKEHFWYMNVTDEFGAERRSMIYRFTTDEKTGGGGVVNPSPEPAPTPNPKPEPAPNPGPSVVFKDVPLMYRDSVEYLVAEGIAKGITPSLFGTGHNIKRADAAVMLANALKLNFDKAKSSGFKDVPARAEGAVNALKAAGIVSGKTASSFGAQDNITRGEMAIMLAEAYKMESGKSSIPFKDVSGRYTKPVAALIENNITQGKTKEQFGTSESITRGEFALFLHRLKK
ncbi:MAG: S-layer homology domain-containing protein [Bacillota bacterium]